MNFTKMHGAGNDFVILDQRDGLSPLTMERIIHICDRRRGVGADQLIILQPSKNADVYMDMYNSDGSPLEACGNATRCVADLLNTQTIETIAGILKTIRKDDLIQVNMGTPTFPETPFTEDIDNLSNPTLVDMGNPHAVYIVDDLEAINIPQTGAKIENHAFFPNRTNVEFVQIESRTKLRLRTWERGAGLTLACGSAACATIAATVQQGLTERKVEMVLDGGVLHMELTEDGEVLMTGPTATVFTGTLF